jgi:iron(III) transport system substrate-binding protein
MVPTLARSGALVLAVGAMLLAAGCGGSDSPETASSAPAAATAEATPPSGERIDTLVARSKKEHGLVVYGNPPEALFSPLVKEFRKQYPWISVQASDLEDPAVFAKYEAEHEAGSRTADLLIASAPANWVEAKKQGLLRPIDVVGIDRFPSWADQGSGVFVMSPDASLIYYNALLLKDQSQVPKGLSDLARLVRDKGSSFRGKISTYPIQNGLGYTAFWSYAEAGGEGAWATLAQLGPATKLEAQGGTQLQKLAQGGYVAAYFLPSSGRGVLSTFKGVVKWTYAQDFTALLPRGIGVTKGARSPASAELFIDWMFSKDGQRAMCASGFVSYRNDYVPAGCTSTLADVYKHVPRANVHFVPFSEQLISDRPEIARRWAQAYGRHV